MRPLTIALILALLPHPVFANRRPAERRLIWLTHEARGSRLIVRHDVIHEARRWSQRMAQARGLSHSPNLRRYCATITVGEVVGKTVLTARLLMRAFLHSPGHRTIILAPWARSMGWGTARRDGILYATGVFCGVRQAL